MIFHRAIRLLAVAVLFLLPSILQASPQDASGAALSDIHVSFKLDPRITRSDQMGDRWLSPKTYTGTVAQDTVEAKVVGFDAQGRPMRIAPEWIPSDPEMVTVSPGPGDTYQITVKRAGESSLEITSEGVSKKLSVKAAVRNDAIQVEISQPEAASPAGRATAAQPSANDAQSSPFQTEKEKRSYALGVQVANAIRKLWPEMDPEIYARGFDDSLAGDKLLMATAEVRATLSDLNTEMRKKEMAAQAEKMNELGEKNKKQGEAFLAENKSREGIVTLPSGLQYKVLKAGDGKKPTLNDHVVCHYRAALLDGSELESSYNSKPPTLPVNKLIKGWTEALQLMPVGSKWQLYVPSDLAYGERGTMPRGRIGPNATVIFDVELISIPDGTGKKPAAGAKKSLNKRRSIVPQG